MMKTFFAVTVALVLANGSCQDSFDEFVPTECGEDRRQRDHALEVRKQYDPESPATGAAWYSITADINALEMEMLQEGCAF